MGTIIYVISLGSIFFAITYSEKAFIQDDLFQDPVKAVSFGGVGKQWMKEHDYYTTCGVGNKLDYWLISRYIRPSEIPAELIYVDVDVSFSKCLNKFNKNISCFANYFEVYIAYPRNKSSADNSLPKLITDVSANEFFSFIYNITVSINGTLITTRKSHTFNLKKKNSGVLLAVVSKGACGKLYRPKMFYYYCKETLYINSVKFTRTISPTNGYISVKGNCSNNTSLSINDERLNGLCYSNGSWALNSTAECLCLPGYEPNQNYGCSACSSNFFKPNSSNSECVKCHPNSKSNSNRSSCKCNEGFYSLPAAQLECYALLKIDEDPKATPIANRGLNISWTAPLSNGLNETTFYDVECYTCENATLCTKPCSIPSFYNLTKTFVEFSNVRKVGEMYSFRVYPKNRLNYDVDQKKWNYVEVKHGKLGTFKKANTEDNMIYYVIGTIALLLLILITLLIFCIVKRRKEKPVTNACSNLELINRQRAYIDPSNYDSPEDAVLEFASELKPDNISLEMAIGGGEFGDVYKGVLTKEDKSTIPVAVKTLKYDSTEKNKKDFLVEASIMGQFHHPNVVRLEGVVTNSTPRMIVLEFLSNGSLESYLSSNKGNLTSLQLIGMARGVASGMEYLSGIQFVHRDLAARNVLLNDTMLCKIADFGLSRVLKNTETSRGEYVTSGGRIPIRWTAPEAFKIHTFSSASDVWSYGILLWEIFTFGERPYWDWSNFKVLEMLDEKYRLPAPQGCPKGIYDLMLFCWQDERSDRPSFSEIVLAIEKWIRSPETMEEEHNFVSILENWLKSIKMDIYLKYFTGAGFNSTSQILELNETKLKEMGINLIGHRNKILKGVVWLQEQRNRGTGEDHSLAV